MKIVRLRYFLFSIWMSTWSMLNIIWENHHRDFHRTTKIVVIKIRLYCRWHHATIAYNTARTCIWKAEFAPSLIRVISTISPFPRKMQLRSFRLHSVRLRNLMTLQPMRIWSKVHGKRMIIKEKRRTIIDYDDVMWCDVIITHKFSPLLLYLLHPTRSMLPCLPFL